MTVAVLLATDPAPANARAGLRVALTAAGATTIHEPLHRAEALRCIAALAAAGTDAVLLCAADLVGHPSLLWMLATEPGHRTAALVDPAGAPDVREERGRLVRGEPTVAFLGALHVSRADLPALAAAADRLLAGPAGAQARSVVDELLPELDLSPAALHPRLLHAERVTDPVLLPAAQAAVAAVDEDRARLRLAVKEKDDFFTTYAVSTWSPIVTKWCARLRLTPSGVTAISVVLVLVAAGLFWQASRPAMIGGAILLYLGFVLDCVDGQLARYTRRFGAFGGWIDTMADRAKEYAAYAGLAAGADRLGLDGAWPLAVAAMVLQTVRHMTDAWYGALHDVAATRRSGGTDAGGLGGRLSRASEKVQADTGSPAYWLKRIVVFPIGERWALIAVAAAATNGRVTLLAVLGWAVLAAAYTLGLRSVRSLSMRVAVLDTVDTARHRDDGVLARGIGRAAVPFPLAFAVLAALVAAVPTVLVVAGYDVTGSWLLRAAAVSLLAAAAGAGAPHTGSLDWLVPAALRAAEHLIVVAVGVVGEVPAPLVFALLFALAMHHYDVTARMEKGAPATTGGPLLGWDGRIVLLTLATVAGFPVVAVAVLLGVVLVGFAVTAWRAAHPPEGVPA